MAKYVIEIRKPDQPTVYYLSKRGLRCYDARNVGVFHSLPDASEQLEYFRRMMPTFRLTIARLPARVSLSRALLSAVEV